MIKSNLDLRPVAPIRLQILSNASFHGKFEAYAGFYKMSDGTYRVVVDGTSLRLGDGPTFAKEARREFADRQMALQWYLYVVAELSQLQEEGAL